MLETFLEKHEVIVEVGELLGRVEDQESFEDEL